MLFLWPLVLPLLFSHRHLDIQSYSTVYLIVTVIVDYFIHVLIQPLNATHNKPLLYDQ